MRSRQLYSAFTATTQGTVYFDIPDNTTIRCVQISTMPNGVPTAADLIQIEVSLSATNQTQVSDAQGVLAVASADVASAVGVMGVNVFSPCSMAVKAGTRIYLNATESGTATWNTRAVVWFD